MDLVGDKNMCDLYKLRERLCILPLPVASAFVPWLFFVFILVFMAAGIKLDQETRNEFFKTLPANKDARQVRTEGTPFAVRLEAIASRLEAIAKSKTVVWQES